MYDYYDQQIYNECIEINTNLETIINNQTTINNSITILNNSIVMVAMAICIILIYKFIERVFR